MRLPSFFFSAAASAVMQRLATFVTDRWLIVLTIWLAILAGLRAVAPSWDSVTEDGDFQYLPSRCLSVAGQRLLESRFGDSFHRSQMAVVISGHPEGDESLDLAVSLDVARRLHALAGHSLLKRAEVLSEQATDKSRQDLGRRWFLAADQEFGDALTAVRLLGELAPDGSKGEVWFTNSGMDPTVGYLKARAKASRGLGDTAQAETYSSLAEEIASGEMESQEEAFPAAVLDCPIEEVWTWQTEGIGSALQQRSGGRTAARVAVLHLDTEFLAVANTAVFETLESELAEVRHWAERWTERPPELGISGSAAVGSDLLVASAEAVRSTEIATLVLVVIILAFVYRSPLMILIPMLTIGISLEISLRILALATQIDQWMGWEWWTFSVFKTTRIFVVVILFGAGTDFCLFLIARLRENLAEATSRAQAITEASRLTSGALIASAMTTVLGLGAMGFAEFGKLAYSGPAIAIALTVTLIACLTLAPALLMASRRWLMKPVGNASLDSASQASLIRFWDKLGEHVVRRPWAILLSSLAILAIPAWHGWNQQFHVTYDLLAGLDAERPSRQGTDILRRHFPVGESGPLILLAEFPDSRQVWLENRPSAETLEAAGELALEIEKQEGVNYVRSVASPLGHRGRPAGPSQQAIRSIPSVQNLFAAAPVTDQNHGLVLRFDAVLRTDAFSLDSMLTLERLLAKLNQLSAESTFWQGVRFSVAGTTAAINDLRLVTTSDTQRIEILVVAVVFLVLFLLLRHPVTCAYMVATVLLSYWVAVGLTDWTFAYFYGPDYHGLEWKVPLFLFVILVAVGEDYNVYLASRVFEEQEKHGPFGGLRRAIGKTGGIISSCGVIMAGTFVSMTAPIWPNFVPEGIPWLDDMIASRAGSLQGMIQMGFALTIGVLLDTFVVRPILLPAYLAIVARLQAARSLARGAHGSSSASTGNRSSD